MNKIQFILGSFLSLLSYQLENWQTNISPALRFICFCISSLFALAMSWSLLNLPDGSIEFLLTHMFEPLGAFLLLIVVIISLLGSSAVIIAGKFKSTF